MMHNRKDSPYCDPTVSLNLSIFILAFSSLPAHHQMHHRICSHALGNAVRMSLNPVRFVSHISNATIARS